MLKKYPGLGTFIILVLLIIVSFIFWKLLVNLYTSEEISSITGTLSDLVTIIAIIIGGIWSYQIFVKTRVPNYRLNLEYEILCIKLSDGRFLIKVYLIMENIGNVDIQLTSWTLRAERILPLPPLAIESFSEKNVISESEGIWRAITDEEEEILSNGNFKRYIEPGEIDQAVANIIISPSIQIVKIYTHVKSLIRSKTIGWPIQTIVDLRLVNQRESLGKEYTMPGSRIWYLTETEEFHNNDSNVLHEDYKHSHEIEQSDEDGTDRGGGSGSGN